MPVNFYTMRNTMGYRPSSGHPHTQAPSNGYPLPLKHLNQGPFQPLRVNGFAEAVGKEASYSASDNTGRKRNPPPLRDRLLDPHPKKTEILDLINKIKSEELNRTPYQLDTSVTTTGITYLALALFKNLDEEIIEALARKCDVNKTLSPHHDTALTLAIHDRYPTAGILALIKAMTPDQLNHVTTNDYSALRLALHINPDKEIIKALASKCDGNKALSPHHDTALTLAILNQYPTAGILALIKAMTPDQLNHVTTNGYSALRLALHINPDEEIIKALASKCDVNKALSPHHDTALTLAILNQYPTAGILALIKAMTPDQLNHVTTNGYSALRLAFRHSSGKEIIGFLLLDAIKKLINQQKKPAFFITLIVLAISVSKFGLDKVDIQRIQKLHSDYLKIDDATQKKEALTQLLNKINGKQVKQLDTLARLIRLELALLKHENLSDRGIKEYWENISLLDFWSELMDKGPDPNDDFLICIARLARIDQDDEAFYINTNKEDPLGAVFKLASLEDYMRENPSKFTGSRYEAVAALTMTGDSKLIRGIVSTSIDELQEIQDTLTQIVRMLNE